MNAGVVSSVAARRKARGKSAHEWTSRLSLADGGQNNLSYNTNEGTAAATTTTGSRIVGGGGVNSLANRMHASRSFEANLDYAGEVEGMLERQVTHHTPGTSLNNVKYVIFGSNHFYRSLIYF